MRKTTHPVEACAPLLELLPGARPTVSIQCEVVGSISAALREDGLAGAAPTLVREHTGGPKSERLCTVPHERRPRQEQEVPAGQPGDGTRGYTNCTCC